MSPSGFVTAPDGVRIAYYDSGTPPESVGTVLLLHGYPDHATVWDEVTAELAGEFRVLRYDVRGTGASGQPRRTTDYRYGRLAGDLLAVLDHCTPGQPVHLLAHDWGSVQGWYFVSAPETATRFRSFTSVSGPNPAYLRTWIRTKLAARQYGPVLRQLLHSAYIGFFKLPVVPELAWRAGLIDRIMARSEPPGDRSRADKLNGLKLYRANLLSRSAPPPRPVRVPVHIIAPARDAYITPTVAVETAEPFVAALTTQVVESGHWLPLTDPAGLAAAFTEFVATTRAA